MTEQEPIPQPFDPAPRTPGAPGGCGKPLLVGCGVAAVLLVVAFVVMMLKMPDILAWSLAQSREILAPRLPGELTPAERERWVRAFEGAVAAVDDGTFDAEALPELQSALLDVLGGQEPLTRGQVERLTAALEAVAGIEAEPIERAPDLERVPRPEPRPVMAG
ncbi:MAG: hypothetical protein R3325_14405 [Thermoanaerobaculia bacterium]|nr:hypothetical protein [Thermoanaerobaculia bacterium]